MHRRAFLSTAATALTLSVAGCTSSGQPDEGAEYDILRSMDQRPRELVIETHGLFDAPTDETKALLDGMGYEIIDDRMASPYGSGEEDNRVLWGRRE